MFLLCYERPVRTNLDPTMADPGILGECILLSGFDEVKPE